MSKIPSKKKEDLARLLSISKMIEVRISKYARVPPVPKPTRRLRGR